jgi:hypothetical protein
MVINGGLFRAELQSALGVGLWIEKRELHLVLGFVHIRILFGLF